MFSNDKFIDYTINMFLMSLDIEIVSDLEVMVRPLSWGKLVKKVNRF